MLAPSSILSRRPLLNPLMELLAIRLSWQTTPAKSLVIPQAGEEANEKSNCYFLRERRQLHFPLRGKTRMANRWISNPLNSSFMEDC